MVKLFLSCDIRYNLFDLNEITSHRKVPSVQRKRLMALKTST